jgi:hypothetical protein
MLVSKLYADHELKTLFNPLPLLNGKATYRNLVQRRKIDCAARKVIAGAKIDNFDDQGAIAFVNLAGADAEVNVQEGSPLSQLLYTTCGPARAASVQKYRAKSMLLIRAQRVSNRLCSHLSEAAAT